MNLKSFSVILYIICLVVSGVKSQEIDHWETIVYNTDQWRYSVGTSEPPADWNLLEFNDNSWLEGQGGFGYDDNDDNTQISETVSIYIRREFQISDVTIIKSLLLHADYDDAFVAYLNGVEVARRNIGQPGDSPSYNQTADDWHEAVLYQGGIPEVFTLDAELINDGSNMLAIQIHNQDISSSDLSSSFFLSGGISDTSMNYGETPDWFPEPFISSNLPLVIINTISDDEIFDDPRVTAQMGIIDNGTGERNKFTDEYNDYDGLISIEIRGASSQSFPKKNYSLETQDENGQNLNVSLLGLPEENDWILHGPYTDKSLMRNVLAYHMGRATGRYAPRTRYCELMINGDYRGVYILTEKIKRDKNRVDIAKLTPADISGDELTGGYILQIDRDDESTEEDGWYSNYPNNKFYSFVDPGKDDLLPVQKAYIQSYVDSFERAMNAFEYQQIYTDYVDVPSFVDYFLVTEIGKHIDAFKLSFYLHKKKDSNGGKIHFGPLWDFNLANGNFDFDCPPGPDGWSYIFGETCSFWLPFWVKRLSEIPQVSHQINCRWQELRDGPMHTDTLLQLIDDNTDLLEESSQRNFERWPILGNYVWPNSFVGQTYEEEISFLKNWLTQRLDWMDSNMLGDCSLFVNTKNEEFDSSVSVFPNPAVGEIFIEVKNLNNVEFHLYDLLGRQVANEKLVDEKSILSIEHLPIGMYVYTITSDNKQTQAGKLKVQR